MAQIGNPLSGPIPGQSLTQQPGGAPWEHPAQFTDPNEALEYIFDKMTNPRNATRVVASLMSGIPCEYLARTLVFQGFSSGKWSPDVAGLIIRPVLYMFVAIGARAKVKNLVIMNPDKEQEELLDGFLDVIPKHQAKTNVNKKASKEQVSEAIAAVEEMKEDETKPKLNGVFGAVQ